MDQAVIERARKLAELKDKAFQVGRELGELYQAIGNAVYGDKVGREAWHETLSAMLQEAYDQRHIHKANHESFTRWLFAGGLEWRGDYTHDIDDRNRDCMVKAYKAAEAVKKIL